MVDRRPTAVPVGVGVREPPLPSLRPKLARKRRSPHSLAALGRRFAKRCDTGSLASSLTGAHHVRAVDVRERGHWRSQLAHGRVTVGRQVPGVNGIGPERRNGRSAARGAGAGRGPAAVRRRAARRVHGRAVAAAARRRARGEHARPTRLRAGVRPRSGAAARARTRASPRWSSATAPARSPPPCPTPPDRVLRVGCALLTVEADPAQPGSGPDPDRADAGRARRRPGRPPAAARRRRQRHPAVGDRRGGARRAGAPRAAAALHASSASIAAAPASTTSTAAPRSPAAPSSTSTRAATAPCPSSTSCSNRPGWWCRTATSSHAGALSGYRTASTASDVEQVRAALGVTRLSALGVGDGATAVCMWARTHPGAVGRVVLDGPPNAASRRARRRRGARGGRRVRVRRVRRGLRRRADVPARRRPPWLGLGLRRPPAQPADHRRRRTAADRGHDRHRDPHRARRARGLARPRRRARPGAERGTRTP